MKRRAFFYLLLAVLSVSAMELVSYMWRNGILLSPGLRERYYIGAVLILIFGGLDLLFLYNLKKEILLMNGKTKRHWKNIVAFAYTMNCIGLPIYLIAFLLNQYLSS